MKPHHYVALVRVATDQRQRQSWIRRQVCPGNMVTITAYVYALCHIPQTPQTPQRSYGITIIQYMFLGLFWYQVYPNSVTAVTEWDSLLGKDR